MHSDTNSYRIERLSKDNLGDLERLYHAVYGEGQPSPRFQQKYDTAWSGAAYIGYFAYDGQGTPAAYYGVMPCLLQYGNTLLLSAQSGDTMTHPGHRNKGLFVRLSTMTFELCRKEKILLLFGFPNQNSYPGAVNRLSWTTTENLQGFQIPVTTIPLKGVIRRLPFLKGCYSAYTAALLKKRQLPELGVANSAITNGYGGLYRNETWFRYKTYSKTQVIRLGKAKAWIRITDTFIIGDIEWKEQHFEETLRRIRRLAAWLGFRNVYFHTSPGTLLHQQFAQHYKPFTSFPVLFMDLGSGIPLHQIKFTFADIDTF
jgi:GNAT superfamily N-acetyltransferase